MLVLQYRVIERHPPTARDPRIDAESITRAIRLQLPSLRLGYGVRRLAKRGVRALEPRDFVGSAVAWLSSFLFFEMSLSDVCGMVALIL